jgi:GNAT superfamily N-acetyltransferase
MQIRQANPDDASMVANVLACAAAELVQRGAALWTSEEVSEPVVANHVGQGMYYVGFDDDGVIGVFRFQLNDPTFWPEIAEGSSAFLHKMAVHPSRQGHEAAQLLLGYAIELARQHGRRYLRLDCASGRPKLRGIYERFGFRHHSEKELYGRVFDRFEFEIASPAP